jgi:uncharacterized protein YehS (DUF1456 family)
MQLNATKMDIIEMIAGINNEKALNEISSFVHKSVDEDFERIPGLPYTREERIASVRRAVDDIRAGRVISNEDMGRWINEL